MIRIFSFQTLTAICLVLASFTTCFGDWRAHGRYECEDSPDTYCSGTYDAADCEAAHAGNMTALAPSAPSCQFEPGGPNPPPIYVDEGCTEISGGALPPNDGDVILKIVYTYANGKRLGVERGGINIDAARAAAEAVSEQWESRQDPAVPGTTFGARDQSTRKETPINLNNAIAPSMLHAAPELQLAPQQPNIRITPEEPELGYTPSLTPSTVYMPSQICCPQPMCYPACVPQRVCVPVYCQPRTCTPQPRCRLLRRLFGR